MTTTTPETGTDTAKSANRYRARRLPFIFYIPGFVWRHKGAALAVLGGLVVADHFYGHKLIEKFDPPLVTIDHKFCKTETCTQTARTIIGATALWTQTVKDRAGYTVPAFLNARYVIGSAGIESDLGASLHTKGSRYEGLLQLSRRIDDTHFTDISAELFETIKAAYLKNPDAIPALNEVMVMGKDKKPRKMTPQEWQTIFADPISHEILPKSETRAQPLRYATNKFLRLLRSDRKLFRDPTIQTFAFMEASHKALKGFMSKPHFMELPEQEKHAIMYLGHNHPRMARVTLNQQYCELPVRVLSPRDTVYFPGNSGIYNFRGDAPPALVKFRVMKRQHVYVDEHGPKTGEAALKTSIKPVQPTIYGQYSLTARYVWRPILNKTRCMPTNT